MLILLIISPKLLSFHFITITLQLAEGIGLMHKLHVSYSGHLQLKQTFLQHLWIQQSFRRETKVTPSEFSLVQYQTEVMLESPCVSSNIYSFYFSVTSKQQISKTYKIYFYNITEQESLKVFLLDTQAIHCKYFLNVVHTQGYLCTYVVCFYLYIIKGFH